MGCFNVSCMISKLTIHEGDSCYLLPLIPNSFNRRKDEENTPCSMYLYPNDIYTPLCFPIKGTYDDYGSIENIEKNKNTEILEKYFGISIEEIVEILTDNRDKSIFGIYDSFSIYSNLFFEYGDILKDYSLSEKDILSKLGFRKHDNKFVHPKYRYELYLDKEMNKPYSLIGDNAIMVSTYNFLDNFFKAHYAKTKELFGLKNEELFNKIKDVSASFMLAEVYENLLFYKEDWDYEVTPHFLLNHGFKLKNDGNFVKSGYEIDIKGTINETQDFDKQDVAEFKKLWKSLTKETLRCENTIDVEYQTYVYRCIVYRQKYDDIFDLMLEYNFMTSFAFSRFLPKFLDIYGENLLEVEEDWKLLYKFQQSIYNMNILLTPTFQGCQCGDTKSELYLAKLVYKIIKKRAKEEKA